MNDKYCVYKHTFPNGKVYIGMTGRNPLNRWQGGHGYKSQRLVCNAIMKYGWNNIKHEILFTELSMEEAERLEMELIEKFDSTNPNHGYNISKGGMYGGRGCRTNREYREALEWWEQNKYIYLSK